MNKKIKILLYIVFFVFICGIFEFSPLSDYLYNLKINWSFVVQNVNRNLVSRYEYTYGRLPTNQELFSFLRDNHFSFEGISTSTNIVNTYDGTGGWLYEPERRFFGINVKKSVDKFDGNLKVPNPPHGRVWSMTNFVRKSTGRKIVSELSQNTPKGQTIEMSYLNGKKDKVCHIAYTLDEKNRITLKRIELSGRSGIWQYGYDPKDKLIIEQKGNDSIEYSYDERGNRIQKQIISGGNTNSTKYEYQWYKSQMVENTNTYLPISNEEIETDPYALTLKNILTQWSQDGDSGEYSNTKDTLEYVNRIVRKSDAQTPPMEWYIQWGEIRRHPFKEVGLEQKGERIPKYLALVGGKSRRFEGDQWRYFTSRGGRIVNEMDAEGKVIRTYQYDPDLGELLSFSDMAAEGEKERTYFCITDLQGSILGLMAGEEIIETYEYDSFGNVVSVRDASGSEIQKSAVGNIHLWQGAEYFWEARLYNFYGRLYDPETGRWLTEHPLDAPGHWVNYYPFCFNDPVNKIWRWLPKDSALLKNRNNDSTHEQQLQNVETLR